MLIRVHADIIPRKNDPISHTEANRIPAGHQGGTGRRANGGCIETIELDPLLGQEIEGRSVDVTAMIAHIRPTKIIGDHHQNIGLCCHFDRIVLGNAVLGYEYRQKDCEPIFYRLHRDPRCQLPNSHITRRGSVANGYNLQFM